MLQAHYGDQRSCNAAENDIDLSQNLSMICLGVLLVLGNMLWSYPILSCIGHHPNDQAMCVYAALGKDPALLLHLTDRSPHKVF